jgi:hypothetical protein
MPSQAAVVLSPTKMLNIELGGWMIHYFSDNAGAFNYRLADANVICRLVEQDAVELEAGANVGFPVVKPDDVAFADAVLSRSIFKHGIHGPIPALVPGLLD